MSVFSVLSTDLYYITLNVLYVLLLLSYCFNYYLRFVIFCIG